MISRCGGPASITHPADPLMRHWSLLPPLAVHRVIFAAFLFGALVP